MSETPAFRAARVHRGQSAAIIIGLDCGTGLQSARILARHGVPVIGVAADPGHPCCRTRVCERILTADTAGIELIEALIELGRDLAERAVLYPCTDLSVLLVSRHRAELEPWFHVVVPDPDVVELLIDKARFYAYAQQEGFPIPRTFVLRSRVDAEEAARSLRFPAIVKPALKTLEWKRHASAKAFQVSSAEELIGLYDRSSAWSDTLVAQEWIEGGDGDHFTCNCYFNGASEPLVTFTTRKLRQWPPTGGEGCLSEESRNDAVERETIRLFRTIGHRGLGYLEMKRDARTGEHLIIEPNIGRPTGRSANAEAAGVELLYTKYCDTLGWPLPADREQKYRGVKWIHIRRDFQSALYHWRRGDLTLHEWIESWRGPKTDALLSMSDPVPFLADLGRVGLELVFRRKARRRAE